MASVKQEYISLPLRLKTSDGVIGRLQNIYFISSCVITTVAKYYWYGPVVKAWDLRFHVITNILHRYLSESLPHDTPNKLSEKIDFAYIADYIDMNNLPARPLSPSIGHNEEYDIIVDAELCTVYELPQYGISGDKLNAMADDDRISAQKGQPRTISCQIVVGSQVSLCNACKVPAGMHKQPKLMVPEPLYPNERIFFHFHGGAYCVGERSLTHIYVYAHTSSVSGLRVFSPNYRLAPRSCFPSQLHDCFLSYMDILRRGFKPENIILSGDSAGGALAVALLIILRDMHLPRPAGVVLISPWVDSTCSGASWDTKMSLDYLPSFPLEDPFHPTRMFYAAGRRFSQEMLEELRCPLVSPIFGDLSDMPPMLIQMGRNELLHDDISEFAEKTKLHAENIVRLEAYDNMPHAFVLLDFTDAAQQAFASVNNFAREVFDGENKNV
ncbi:Alpha/Beta hydrolase protein [Kickxella alabastrina]|uniref:Alpha/Beta hydrolase protein n=1 Tax=Kickxella alabastrina TaxID=61397 RepID=UPI00221F28C4|nr:Alpha/Beta hydrolase protein [Kickxella alabastrina]KAI7833537.1 Alpha/Beta hydrolase protein [Kickxella alabastrina]